MGFKNRPLIIIQVAGVRLTFHDLFQISTDSRYTIIVYLTLIALQNTLSNTFLDVDMSGAPAMFQLKYTWSGTDFRLRATLTGASLGGVKADKTTILPDGANYSSGSGWFSKKTDWSKFGARE